MGRKSAMLTTCGGWTRLLMDKSESLFCGSDRLAGMQTSGKTTTVRQETAMP
jgi:hypothetical protein